MPLPEVSPPYLPAKEPEDPVYTLVLDLDETLIHYSEGIHNSEQKNEQNNNNLGDNVINESWCFYMRPGLFSFLRNMANYYELVLYTAAMRDYANYFLQRIDQDCLIKHVLCREHCQINKGGSGSDDSDIQYFAMKDIRLLGRDIAKSLIIDNLEENFKFTTPDSGIRCENFEGDMDDVELTALGEFLETVAKQKVDDLRPHIAQYKLKQAEQARENESCQNE